MAVAGVGRAREGTVGRVAPGATVVWCKGCSVCVRGHHPGKLWCMHGGWDTKRAIGRGCVFRAEKIHESRPFFNRLGVVVCMIHTCFHAELCDRAVCLLRVQLRRRVGSVCQIRDVMNATEGGEGPDILSVALRTSHTLAVLDLSVHMAKAHIVKISKAHFGITFSDWY